MISKLDNITIEDIQREYHDSADTPWYLGYSGGKDSSALLTLVFNALLDLSRRTKPITVLYCNTGVEIPIVQTFVSRTFRDIEDEAERYHLPIRTAIVKPAIKDSYFVKVIGRGYPPPTNIFRWCTDRLRINPIQQAISKRHNRELTVLLGIRRGESQRRDQIMVNHAMDDPFHFQQSNNRFVQIYSPIANYSVEDVWSTIALNTLPESINREQLFSLYRVLDGRFGCWTCTVISRDRAMESLIAQGHFELQSLLNFRNWLAVMRDESANRCSMRRNGQRGLGPLTLAARAEILKRLRRTERESGLTLISDDEVAYIKQLWNQDKFSSSYSES